MPRSILESHSPVKVALIGGILAIIGSLTLTFLSVWYIGMEQMNLLLVAGVATLCPALIAPPTIYYQCVTLREVARQKRELLATNNKLKEVLNQVQELSGMLPICAWCHKVRDDTGYWEKVEAFIERNTGSSITHGVCPDCHTRELEKLSRARP